ncbi:M13 family metallopeptidase [Telluria mixta]|uniref:M13 family metallopeptidase n=1 Tax=Telluria mixta TaxID=34071 RepID=A0ABT2BU95_9BURK|nr:M13 family metallopeptidase [Telluria mixta]MCS0628689.1 M13 family metallopeptidase [Telluria mixta]WEM97145.1 M13 family metallopeptidase [Telluria mixta]
MKRLLCSALILGVFAGQAYAAPADTAPSGVDKTAVDPAFRPQDDFFRYSQGKWLHDVDIPADRASWGAFNIAQENVETQIRTLIEQAAQDKTAKAGSNAQKMGDYYASYIDRAHRDALGVAPLKGELARIAALKDKRQLAALAAHFDAIGAGSPLSMSVQQDARQSTRYLVVISQSGLGMPNRDYYLQDDARLADTRAKYQAHVEKLLTLAGQPDAAGQAARIVALETAIAQAQWSAVENRDPVKTYNRLTVAQLKALAPGFDWAAWMKTQDIAGKADAVNVEQPTYVQKLDGIVATTPVDTWKSYFTFRVLSVYAPYLSQAFVDENFAFRGMVLSGAKVNRPTEKLAIAQINRDLGEVVGKVYVEHYFPAERRRQVEEMVHNFLLAYKDSIETLDWMTPETKKQAQAKLAKIAVKVGYPDKWRDYSSLAVKRADLVGNVMRSRAFAHRYAVAKLGKPVDRAEWHMTPQTVNAYYSPEMNEVVFPAARLQAPLYDADAEPAINYGAVGISIGHEISHAFDDQGAQYDGDGNLRNWWTKEDGEKFAAKGKVLVAQYAGYSPVEGYHLNGELTLGENIADNAGAIMASRAYKISLHGKPAPVIDGFTAEQRIFMGLAQARRGKARDAALIAQVKSDPHSPSEFRVNGSLRNHPGFYDAFDVKPGDRMYLAPQDRVVFW